MTLDEPVSNYGVGYTHSFSIPSGHSIVSATLEVRIFAGHGGNFFALDRNVDGDHPWNSGFGPRAVFAYLTEAPIVGGQFLILTLDLEAVPMRQSEVDDPDVEQSLIADLLDGSFNVGVAGDAGVDYSRLVISTMPAIPTVSTWGMIAMTLLTLTAGTLVLSRRKKPHLIASVWGHTSWAWGRIWFLLLPPLIGTPKTSCLALRLLRDDPSLLLPNGIQLIVSPKKCSSTAWQHFRIRGVFALRNMYLSFCPVL